VDENNPGYEVRFNPELKTRPWSIGVPGGKLVARSTSASGLRKAVMKQPKVGPREAVDGVDVVRYPAVKPKPVTTPAQIFSRDAVDPDDIAGKLNEAQQEQVDLLIEEIDKARKARDINDAERTELVRMLEDTREVIPIGSSRPEVTTGRNEAEQRKKYTELLKNPNIDAKTREGYRRKLEQLNSPKSDFVWSIINSTQSKLDSLRKAGRRLRGRQDAVGKDLFEKGVKLTPEEQAARDPWARLVQASRLRLLTAAHGLGWLAAGKGATMQVLCIECSMAGSPRPAAARQTQGLAAKLVQSSSGSGR
jgi:hypothetical protein